MDFLNCKKRDRKATEHAILMAASSLFAEKGYEGTRTLEISKLAGANEALITRYFGGKEGLLAAVIKNEEAIQSMMNSKKSCESRALELFPEYISSRTLQDSILLFFDNGRKVLREKAEFMRIVSSRVPIDAEMAATLKKHIIEYHVPHVMNSLMGYPQFQNKKKQELEAIGLLIMSTHYNMNFMHRTVYEMDEKQIDLTLEIFAQALQARYPK